jgi:membrane-associated phospholipid phosphatase
LRPGVRSFRPEEAIFLLGIGVLIVLHIAYGIALERGSETLQHYLIAFAILAMMSAALNWKLLSWPFRAPRRFIRPFLSTCRDWLPFVSVVIIYENIQVLVTEVVPGTKDRVMMDVDRAIFGVDPTLWIERFATPVLTDYLTFAYLMYFLLPISVLTYLYIRERTVYRQFMMATVVSFVLTFIGYILVPTEGPIMFMPGAYHAPLKGILYDPMSASWDTMRSMTRDCFPSHHTIIGILSVYYALRIRDRRWRPFVMAVVILGISLIISAFYLRYHWAVDIFAGFVVAGISIWVGNNMDRWWRKAMLWLPKPMGATDRG